MNREEAIMAVKEVTGMSLPWNDRHYEALQIAIKALEESERKTGRWNKLMMYLADLQLTYSPDWGANGCGDEKLYEFITGLIEELEGWEDGGGA